MNNQEGGKEIANVVVGCQKYVHRATYQWLERFFKLCRETAMFENVVFEITNFFPADLFSD
jgi:hypothetical protein